MIAFHLVYIGDAYPLAKSFVYTFHMPAFLIISGYMFSPWKGGKQVARGFLWLFIPYAIMEAGYTIMASILPIREHIDSLTPIVLLEKIFIHPLGPYWYLHTLILCSLTYYVISRLSDYVISRLSGGAISRQTDNAISRQTDNAISRLTGSKRLTMFILLAIVFYVYDHFLNILYLPHALYFMAGAIVRQSKMHFLQVFQPSWFAVIPVILLSMHPDNLHCYCIAGILITYLMISLCLAVYKVIPQRIMGHCLFIGRNTLPLLLFSPIFTVVAKTYQPYLLHVEPSGMLFLFVSLALALSGCFLITYAMDKLHISPLFFGKAKALQ